MSLFMQEKKSLIRNKIHDFVKQSREWVKSKWSQSDFKVKKQSQSDFN